jgi:antitoxin YefM
LLPVFSAKRLHVRTDIRTLREEVNTTMTTLNVTEARARLYSLIDEAASSHKPIIIRGKRGNAVLLSESDWNAIAETLHLLSIPGMRNSIQEGLKEDPATLAKELDW